MVSRRTFLKGAAWLGASLTSFGAYAVGVEPMLWPRVASYALTPAGWPPELKIKIVALADIHAVDPWMTAARIKGIVDAANALEGNIILLLGDYVSGTRWFRSEGMASEWGPVLGALRAPLGVHAILGNHDWWEDKTAMRAGIGPTIAHRALLDAGIAVHNNDAVHLSHEGRSFWLAGLGDQLAFVPARRRLGRSGDDDLQGTLAKTVGNSPVVLMAHEPDIFPRVATSARHVALTLCGHTHGGQVNLLGWRPAAGSRGSRIYPRGHFRENGRDLLVSSGLGCSIAPIRVGVPPEIMVVELGGGRAASPK
ncbi:MAG: metallophosphoesterase [Methylocystis sp.]|nr:metallophosphoesterase [Methylocystis sp.]MCA3585884.1 metallophosphoesterase [Methylocystis sp.]MCA3586606.1 metallophosphoesterase [Methylocystis sp.]MCA3590884.1 metallophosphoesterase [Methylocystis sp.]